MPTIYSLYKACELYYQQLCDALQDCTLEEAAHNHFHRDLSLAVARDASSRFKVWAQSIRAHQRDDPTRSLDLQSEDAEGIRERIRKILEDLQESLVSAHAIISGEEENETGQVGASFDSDDEESASPDPQAPITSEVEELFTSIESANSDLMKLSVIIRNSPSRDDYLKAAARVKLDPTWDIGHVREKHGRAMGSREWLVERLGKSITIRRQYLEYRKNHHAKLDRDFEVTKEGEPNPANTLAEPKMARETTHITMPKLPDQDGSDPVGSSGSQTSYDQTMMGGTTEHRLTVPQVPEMAFEGIPFMYGEPFECPYCYTEQRVANQSAWKKHVLGDLRPYVCTFQGCGLRMFRCQDEWFLHELQAHRREWTCPYCQHDPFSSKDNFLKHLSSSHPGIAVSSQSEALILQCEEPVDKIPASACFLCDDWERALRDLSQNAKQVFLNDGELGEPYGTLAQFQRHLGHHMEQLALFALPIREVEGADDESLEQSDNDGAKLSSGSKNVHNDRYDVGEPTLESEDETCMGFLEREYGARWSRQEFRGS